MFHLFVIPRVRLDILATRFLLGCGLIWTVLRVPAAPAGEDHIGDGQLSQEYRLPRENLLVYRGPDGARKPVVTTDDWRLRRDEIIAGMQSVMGRLPGPEKRCPLDMRVEEEVDCPTYIRRAITYCSEPGSRVPAYLLIPKKLLRRDGERAPAV